MLKKLYAIPAILLFCLAGCGSTRSDGKVAVTGSVAYDGQLVEEGQIVFEPIDDNLPMAVGQIRQGSYRIDAERGPAAGSYRVRIEAYEKVHNRNLPKHPYLGEDQEAGVVARQYLPASYNSRTTLTAEITDEAENTQDFNLTPQKS